MATVAKVTEISCESSKGFEDAVNEGIKRACKTLKNVEGVWIKEQKIVVKNGAPHAYRVTMKVTFVLAD